MALPKIDIPKVTVIIPCYNREEYIGETVESVLNQTYPNIELVCVDDGCTDGTRKILDSYVDKLMVLEHPKRVNKGQSAAINLGMKNATGKYIAILDSDDLFAPQKIESQVDFLEKHIDVGLVYVNGHVIDEDGRLLYEFLPKNHEEHNIPARTLLESHFNVPSNALVRRSVYEIVGEFDETMRSAQDHDMAVRISEVTTIAYINKHLWSYRLHPETQSSRFAMRRWKIGFKILDKACKRYDYGFTVRRKRLAVLNFRLGQCCIQDKKYLTAFVFLSKAVLLDPLRALKTASSGVFK